MNKKLVFIIIIGFLAFLSVAFLLNNKKGIAKVNDETDSYGSARRFWSIQAVDTMKYSRDTARSEAQNPEFEIEIATQVKNISDLGATHIAIGTPYDEEFIPFMKKWVNEARKNKLKVWYRGNWAGWEEWFEYDKISRSDHLRMTEQFILDHPELFEDGDIFTPCPECENGGPGDPRQNPNEADVEKYRKFLRDLHQASDKSFREINKDVHTGYFSMNGDVARLIMDERTTSRLEDVVVVDHYVKSPELLNFDVTMYADKSKGKVILGEFGVPIPDIHGDLNDEQQAEWLEKALKLLSENRNLIGLNYWTAVGGSTEIFKDGRPTLAAEVLKKYYSPKVAEIQIVNELNEPIEQAVIKYKKASYKPGKEAKMDILYVDDAPTVSVSASEYDESIAQVSEGELNKIVLMKSDTDFVFSLRKWLAGLGLNL
jgi:hypothetical protein